MSAPTTVLKNCNLFDGVSEKLLAKSQVVIQQQKIIAVLPKDAALPEEFSTNCNELDMADQFVMPGLIDAHFHCNSYTLNLDELDHSVESYRSLQAGKLLKETLLRGFTTVRDAAGGDIGLVKAVNEGVVQGPRIFSSGKALSQTGGHGDMRPADRIQSCGCGYSGALSVVADGEDAVRKAAREQLRAGAHQLKIFVSGGVLSPTDPLWMPQFTRGEIRAVVEEAASRRTYVLAHSHTADSAKRCVEEGVRSIEHGTMIDKPTAEFIAKKQAYVDPTLVVMEGLMSMSDKILPEHIEKLKQLVDQAYQALEHCVNAGVKLGFGTDLFGELHGMENREFELRARVNKPIDVLRSATSVNAELMQQDDLGIIKPGAWADLIVLSGNPLEDIRVMAQDKIKLIMKSGEIIKNDFAKDKLTRGVL